ncbi:unnamed protein product [Ostreobium quekettii]|uniref:Uncharacterized protein n=1 Tax=Ostreobium quekettii TaxID=121088 RepID=A0A8S1ISI4_9CHLO|nr:unnamed protein product [Ostreobium quekettii]|eukprot:evm.model.scf_19.9 EVM.evm.TU.scf_19.9   scf_19:192000-195965(+)
MKVEDEPSMLSERQGWVAHWKCLVATISIIAFTFMVILGDASEYGTSFAIFLVGVIFLCLSIILYVMEVWYCSTRSFVHNVLSTESAVDFVNRLKSTPPVVGYHMSCYNLQVRVRTTTDSTGNTMTQTYTEKVTTWTGSESFHFHTWKDTSGSVSGLEDYEMAKLRLIKEKGYLDRYTRESFQENRARFVAANRHRDDFYEMNDTLDIDGFRDSVLALRDINERPWWLYPAVFYIASLLLLTWPYRVLLNSRVISTKFKVVKSISAEPTRGEGAPTSASEMSVVDVR